MGLFDALKGWGTVRQQEESPGEKNEATPTPPAAKKIPAGQIPVSDEKIVSYFDGNPDKFIHAGRDDEDALDEDLAEEGGTNRLKKIVSDLARKMGVSPPPDILVIKEKEANAAAAKIGTRSVILISQATFDELPPERRWDYLEALLAHEVGHFKSGKNLQFLDMIHPENQSYQEQYFKNYLAADKALHPDDWEDLSEDEQKQRTSKIKEKIKKSFANDQSAFAEELAVLKPHKVHPLDQKALIEMELRCDREGIYATKKPEMMKEMLIWCHEQQEELDTVAKRQLVLAKEDGLDHPLLPTRFAQIDYFAAIQAKGRQPVTLSDASPQELLTLAATPLSGKNQRGPMPPM